MNFLRRFRRRRSLSWEEEFGAGRTGGLYQSRGHSDNPIINFWNTKLGWEADPWDKALIARKAGLRTVLIALLVMLPAFALSFLLMRGSAYAESYGPPAPESVWRAAVVPYELPDEPVLVQGASLSVRQVEQMRDSFTEFFTAFDTAQREGNSEPLRNLLTEEFYEVMAASAEAMRADGKIRRYDIVPEIAGDLIIDEATPNNAPVEASAYLDGFFARYEQTEAGEILPESEEFIARFEVSFVLDQERDYWLISDIGLYMVELAGPDE